MARKGVPYLFVLLAAITLALFEGDLLYRLQEQNLFMHTPLFFTQRMVAAGGLLTWAGSYLTQFFYQPTLGAGLLCLLWAFFMFIAGKAFRMEPSWFPLTLVPVACLLLNIVDEGYWVYYLKLPGHAYVATLGSIVAVALAWGYALLSKRSWPLRILIMLLTACLGYPFLGFYALWALVLMAVMSGRNKACRWPIDVLAALLLVAFVPLVCYYCVFHETNIEHIYWVALPVYGRPEGNYPAYALPYVVLVGSVIAMASGIISKTFTQKGRWLRAAILASTAICVAVFWQRDDNFHRELSMSRDLEQQQWQPLLQTAKDTKGEPTRAICMMKNLALSRIGQQGSEQFHYPEGAKRPAAPFSTQMVHTVGRQLYLQYGLLNYCYRWCMEDGVEYGWTVEKLKLMAKCSLLSGEMVAAQRYLNMLKKTDCWSNWAKHYETYIHNPQLIAQDAELKPIIRLQQVDNFLTADQSQMERFLLEHFATADSNEPLVQEQKMIAAMQVKDMKLFWQQFYWYTETHRGQRVPTHYQEAACLFGHLQNIDVSYMPFDRTVVQNYQDFAGTVGEYQRQGKSIDEIRPLVYDAFHQTYYYDFYFNRYNYIER